MHSRLKVATACNKCRRRKTKCDAQYPMCQPCRDRGEQVCVYERDSTRAETRLSRIQNRHNSSRVIKPSPISRHTTRSENPNDEGAGHERIGSDSEPTRPFSQINSTPRLDTPSRGNCHPSNSLSTHPSDPPSVSTALSTEHEPISDQADAMTGTISDPSTSKEFFGRSSVSSFVRQVSSVINTKPASEADKVTTTQASRLSSVQTTGPVDHHDYMLPPRRYADDLLVAYYDLVWAVFPILDRTVLQSAYEGCWLGSSCAIPEHVLYCIVNLVFALGSQFSAAVEPSQRRETGLSFWNRARKLYHYDNREASLERVQCLLLMGLYLQSTSESYECWMTVGSAIRMAQSLGLHSCVQSTGHLSRRDDQIRRRVWHGCVYQDRVLSMTFGRPSMIAKWLQTPSGLPAMIDDEYLDTQTEPSATRPDGGPTVMAFFRKSLELYDIINDTLIELYLDPKDSRNKEIHHLGLVLGLDQRLVEWVESLPDHLKYSHPVPDEPLAFRRQRVVLRARYLQARMILFRPTLADLYLKPSDGSDTASNKERSLSHNLIVQCARLCFGAAHEMLDVLYDNFNFDTVTGPVPAWWFSVLYIYTAATVLLSERLPSVCGPSQVSELWTHYWDRAIELLGAYARVGESAKRCMAALGLLSAKVQDATNRSRGHDNGICAQVDERHADAAETLEQDSEWLNSIEHMDLLPDLGHIDFDVDDSSWLIGSNVDMILEL